MKNWKRKPGYFRDFIKHKNLDLIFIATDWNALNLIQRFNRYPCLLCENNPNFYDLDFCANKEVWVLYSKNELLSTAMNLARTIQFLPAKKVILIQVESNTLQGVKNANS